MKIFTLSLQNIWLQTELLSSCRPQWIRVDINKSIHNPTPNCIDVNDNHDKRAAHNEFVSTSMTIDDKWQHAHNEFVSTSIRHVSTSQWQSIMTNIRMRVDVNDNGQTNSTGDTMHNKRISFCTHNEFVSTSIDDASMIIDRWQMKLSATHNSSSNIAPSKETNVSVKVPRQRISPHKEIHLVRG